MIDLEKLFSIRPFIFYVRNEYFAFGAGVCSKCNNESQEYITLPLKYNRYQIALGQPTITQSEAWDAYRKVHAVADIVQATNNPIFHQEQFEEYGFSNEEENSIQHQLEQLTAFFRNNHLSKYMQ